MSAPTLLGLLGLLASGAVGAAVGRLMRLPMWPMTGALLGAAVYHLSVGGASSVPDWWNFVAQVLVGTLVGVRLTKSALQDFRAFLLPGLATIVVVVALGVGLGAGMAAIDALGPVEAVFGMVPGGVGEMVAAVASLDGDSALVAGIHLVRLLAVLSLLPIVIGWLVKRRDDGSGAEGGQSTS